MRDKFISTDRKNYLRKIRIEKIAVFGVQIRNTVYHNCFMGSLGKSKYN